MKRINLIFFGTYALLVILAFGGAWITDRNIRQDVYQSTYHDLNTLVQVANQVFHERVSQYRQYNTFLYGTPPISGLVRAHQGNGLDPLDNTTTEQWYKRLETIFVEFLRSQPDIDQLRIIEFNGEGDERLRVERERGLITVAAPERLQYKGDRNYVQAAKNLKPGQDYISSIDLNQEFGAIERPFKPTIRFARAIFYPNTNEMFGLLVMNVNAEYLIKATRDTVREGFQLYIESQDGSFVEHPEQELRFSADLNTAHTWAQDYVQLTKFSDYPGLTLSERISNGERLFSLTKMVFDLPIGGAEQATDREAQFILRASTPQTRFEAEIATRNGHARRLLFIGFVAMLIFLLALQRMFTTTEALARARTEFAAIFNGSGDAIIGVNAHMLVTSWNIAAYHLFGKHRDEVIGQPIKQLKILGQIGLAHKIKSVLTLNAVDIVETSLFDSNGEERDISVRFSPITQDSGRVTGVAMSFRDITDLKHAQRKLQHMASSLEHKVQERTAELKVAHKQALKASEVKTQFISNISHEMRTPLNGILGSLTLLTQSKLSDAQTRLTNMMQTSADALYNLINDVLDLSKIEADKLEFIQEDFYVIPMLENLIQSLSERAGEKDLELVIDVSAIKHTVLNGDSNRIKQIIGNLLSNALKFTLQGHIVLRCWTQPGNDDDTVVFYAEVIDTGIGIASETQKSLFQPFSQEHDKNDSRFGGTGLGLAICKRLTSLMDGDISCKSEPGKGTRMSFHVDCKVAMREQPELQPTLTGTNTLVVVTNTHQRQALCALLQRFGASVKVAKAFDASLSLDAFDAVFAEPDSVEEDNYESHASTVLLVPHQELQQAYVAQRVLDVPFSVAQLLKLFDPNDINLPLLGEKDSAVVNIIENELIKPLSLHVMVVDDNEINIEIAKEMLTNLGVTCCAASNGLECIEKLQATDDASRVDLILMDCQMPELDGYAATQRIRKGAAGKRYQLMPIIALTANAMLGERERCLQAGMSDYLTKPINPVLLQQKIAQWHTAVKAKPLSAE